MLVQNQKSGKVIDVPADHFANVLSQQGWEVALQQDKGKIIVTDVVVESADDAEVEEIVLESPEPVKRGRGRPKKVTVEE